MGRFFTDFSGYAIGAAPSDWTERWTAAGGTPTVENTSLPTDTGAQALKLAAGTNARYALSWDAVGTPSGDVDLLMRVQSAHTSDLDGAFRAMIHGSGSAASESAYVANAQANVNTLQMFKYVAGSATVFGTETVTLDHDVWYWVQLQTSGTTVRSRMWADGDAMPDWQETTTDSALTSGWVGIGELTSAGTVWVSQFGVGTGGDSAPSEALDVPTVAHEVYGDDFTDTNGDPWDAAKWTTGQNGTGVVDIQVNRGRMLAQGAAFGYCRALSDMTALTDQQVLVSFAFNSTSEQYWSVSLRHSGVWDAGIPANPNDGYWFEVNVSNNLLTVHKGVGGTRTDIDDVAFTWTANTRYWIRAEARGTTIRARVWEDGEAEPGTWNLSTTDASHSSGVPALSGSNGADAAARTILWDDFTVDDLMVVSTVTVAPYLTYTPEFRLAIFPPLSSGRRERLDSISIDPQVTSLQWRSSWPYGFDELRVGLDVTHETPHGPVTYSRLPERVHTQPFNHVQLWANSALVFEGRMAADTAEGDAFTAYGYWNALSDSYFTSTDTATDTTGNVLRDVLSAVGSNVNAAQGDFWQDPQVVHAPADFDGMTARQVMDQVVREGNNAGALMDWGIWEHRRMVLIARESPSQADYVLAFDPSRMRWQRDSSELRSAVLVEFTAFDSGTATITSGNTSVTVTHTLGFTPDARQIRVVPTNSMGAGAKFYIDNIDASGFRINLVAPQETTGSATVTSAATSVAVTHGLSRTPDASEIHTRLTNLPTTAIGEYYVDTIGGTQFTIRTRNAPGAATAIFDWRVRLSDTMVATAPGTPTATFAWEIEAPGTRTSWAEDNTFIHRWGVVRRQIINAGLLTVAAAESIRDTILAESQDVKHRIGVTWPFDEPLPGPQSQPTPPWLLRAGRWVQVADAGIHVLVRVSVDANAGRVQFEAGNRELTYRSLLEALERDTQALRNRISPVTGGKT